MRLEWWFLFYREWKNPVLFLFWLRLDEKGSRGSLSSSIKGPVESDNDSMEEYGEAAEAGKTYVIILLRFSMRVILVTY